MGLEQWRVGLTRPKVSIVSPEFHSYGGTERSLLEQVNRWTGRFDMRLYSMRVENVDSGSLVCRHLPNIRAPHLLRYLCWLTLNRIVRSADSLKHGLPDLIYSPGINALDADAISVHIVFSKYWSRVREHVTPSLKDPKKAIRAFHRILFWNLLRSLEGRVYRGPATIWAVSREDARELECRYGRPPFTVPVIPHGVDTHAFSLQNRLSLREESRKRLVANGSRVLLLIGNDEYKKGVDLAIKALPFLPNDVTLSVAGHLDVSTIKKWAQEAGVVDRVTVWPHVKDVRPYFAAADVFVAPSREDAFHLPALEAMACGLPVVLSGKAGVAELLENGRHALVLEDPEDVPALHKAISTVLSDPKTASLLTREGRKLAVRHTWAECANSAALLMEKEIETPRVLLLALGASGKGGVQRATSNLVRGISAAYGAERIALLSLGDVERDLPCRATSLGVERNRLRVSLWLKLRFLVKALLLAFRWRKRLIVVAAHPHLGAVAWACSRFASAPFVVWCHGIEAWGQLRRAIRFSLKKADGVWAGSRFTAREVELAAGLTEGSVHVTSYCLSPDLDLFQSASSKEVRRVLAVARLEPEHAYKGVDILLKSWPLVLERIPDSQLVIVGEGRDRTRLETLAETFGIRESVTFRGRISDRDLVSEYLKARVFALPGRVRRGSKPQGEGFGLVFLEAAAAGLPVIAGRAGGAFEAVDVGKTGVLVDPDDYQDVASAITQLLESPELSERMGREGRERVRNHFTFEVFESRISELLSLLPVRNLAKSQGS